MSRRISLDRALTGARANRYGRVVGRHGDNRIEPECWPHVEPGFRFTKDQKFFAIGSCFARNIAKRLALDGYHVLDVPALSEDQRSRFTPASIFQELAWADRIYRRDDRIREDDVLPLLLDLGDGQWADLWSVREKGSATDFEAAIARRTALYRYFRGAFEADVVVITLGLIEAWWDQASGSYVEFDTAWARRADRERFQFECLTFETCKAYVERALGILLDGKRRVLLTTSPVTLGRTFTDKDVIVANNHSKSVLRAVAGEISDAFDNVDYFPSYEIATLTRRPEVWEDDLIHVQPNFIARIMQHVTDAYVPGSVAAEERKLMKMANLVEALQFDAAKQLYDEAGDAVWSCANAAIHVAALRLASRRGDFDLALAHASRVELEDSGLYENHPAWMFDVARALAKPPEQRERSERARERIARHCLERPELLQHIFVDRNRAGDVDGVRESIAMICTMDVDHPTLIHKVAQRMAELGRADEALALVDRQLRFTPRNALVLSRRARILLALNRPEEAAQALRDLIAADSENGWAELVLSATLNKIGRTQDALTAIEPLCAREPANAEALSLKARLLWKLGSKAMARSAARAAADAAGHDPKIVRGLERLLDDAA